MYIALLPCTVTSLLLSLLLILGCGGGGGGGGGGVGVYSSDMVIKRAKLTIRFWYVAYFINYLCVY